MPVPERGRMIRETKFIIRLRAPVGPIMKCYLTIPKLFLISICVLLSPREPRYGYFFQRAPPGFLPADE